MNMSVIIVEESNEIYCLLKNEYQCIRAHSYDDVVRLMANVPSCMICISAGLEGEQAEQICTRLKQEASLNNRPVIIFHQNESTGLLLKWFDYGCDDFICLHNEKKIIKARIERCSIHFRANRQLQVNLDQASEAAFTAMSTSSDLGVNMRFMVQCLECENVDQLIQLLFTTLRYYDVQCSIQIRSLKEVKNYEANGFPKELEAKLLDTMRDCGRFYEFGKRCVINFDRISLLVKDMPTDTPEKQGSLKDSLMILLHGCNQKIITLEQIMIERKERLLLKQLTQTIATVLRKSDLRYKQALTRCAEYAEDLLKHSEASIFNMDLTEQQEKELGFLADTFAEKTDDLLDQGLAVDQEFIDMLSQLGTQIGENSSQNLSLINDALGSLPKLH